MDRNRWSSFGKYESRILLLEEELREMCDVRDISTVEVAKSQFGVHSIRFHVAFDTVPEGWRDANLYIDDEGYHRVRAFERDGQWHWCIRRLTILDIVDFQAIREESLAEKQALPQGGEDECKTNSTFPIADQSSAAHVH